MLETMSPQEEYVLKLIQTAWLEKDHKGVPKHKKMSITEIMESARKDGYDWSHEWTRQMVAALHGKGELLIDVKGRERLCRPNHVTINSKTQPESLRNFTIVDPNTNMPISRIWASVYSGEKGKYAVISESKWDGRWRTTSNIIIPKEAVQEFSDLVKFILHKTNE